MTHPCIHVCMWRVCQVSTPSSTENTIYFFFTIFYFWREIVISLKIGATSSKYRPHSRGPPNTRLFKVQFKCPPSIRMAGISLSICKLNEAIAPISYYIMMPQLLRGYIFCTSWMGSALSSAIVDYLVNRGFDFCQ